ITNLKNDITNFKQRFDETFSEAWDGFKDLLRKCPHHNFSELHQIDTFYNALTKSDQDSLNAAAGENLLNSTPRDALTIIENKSKVRTSRNKPVVSKVNTTTSSSSPSLDITALTDIPQGPTIKEERRRSRWNSGSLISNTTSGELHQIDTFYNALTKSDQDSLNAAAGENLLNSTPRDALTIIENKSKVRSSHPLVPLIPRRLFLRMARALLDVYGEELTIRVNDKAITFKFGNTSSYSRNYYDESEVEHETNVTKDKVQPTSLESTAHVQLLVVQVPILEPKVAPKPNPKPRLFLRMARALLDVYGEELTIRVNDKAITFKFGNTSSYSRNYYDESVNQINVLDVACEEYAQKVFGFLNSSTSGNPTPSNPIIASSSPSFTPFKGDFILEEIEIFLRTPDELSNLDDDYYDTEGDIHSFEKFLNEDPSPNLPSIKNEDLKQVEVNGNLKIPCETI
nr:reverse transcriptase domain-containing protein [Tanacetum cinerariifolium]